MQNNFEKYIKEHKDQLDTNEPADGHFQRFEQKLQQQQEPEADGKIVRIRTKTLWRAAAMFLVLVGITSLLNIYFEKEEVVPSNDMVAEMVGLKDVSPEFAEVESFYTSTLNTRMDDLNTYRSSNNEDYITNCIKVLNELEEEYEGLKKDLSANFGDERIINSMIQNYRTRLQVIERLLTQLEASKKYKTINHEDVQA